MSKKTSYVTKEGLKKLQEELERLQTIERPKISKAIGEAIEKGDISENAEYDEATRTITVTAKDNFVQRGKYLFTYDGKAKNFIAEEYVEPVESITRIFLLYCAKSISKFFSFKYT